MKIIKKFKLFESTIGSRFHLLNENLENDIEEIISTMHPKVIAKITDDIKTLLANNIDLKDDIIKYFKKNNRKFLSVTQDDMYDYVNNVINIIKNKNSFSKEDLIKKAKENNVDVVFNSYDKVILKIDTFEKSNICGSQNWVWSTHKDRFNLYFNNGITQIYFIYDFIYDFDDKEFMISALIESDGKMTLEYKDGENCPINKIKSIQRYIKPISKENLLKKIDTNSIFDIIKYGFLDLLKQKVRNGYDPTSNNNKAILDAVGYDKYDIVKYLIDECGIDPSINDNFLLTIAVGENYYDIVKLLINDKRVDPSHNNNLAIRAAISNEVRELLESDPRVREKGGY